MKLDRNEKLNKQLLECISALTVPLATCGEGSEVKPKATTCLITQSEPYQILLQDSNAKDEQIRQSHAVRADNENLKLQLKVKVQELDSKSVEADEKLAAKDDELHHLKVKLDHYEKLNKQLRERIMVLTVPLATCGEGSEVKPKASTDILKKSGQTSKSKDTEKKQRKASMKIEEQANRIKKLEEQIKQMSQFNSASDWENARIRELKQQIEDMELKQGSELEEANAQIVKMTSDHIGVIEHSKKQSKAIFELKDQLKVMFTSHHEIGLFQWDPTA